MDTQLIQDGQIDSDTINQQDLLKICAQMLAESKQLGTLTDTQQTDFIQKYHTFSAEYPSVFNIIMMEKQFHVKPFLKYLAFKKKQPLVYTNTEQCVRDLCYYPIQLYKHLNPHYNQSEFLQFCAQLTEKMTADHNNQKQKLKELTSKVLEQQSYIKQNLIDQIQKLAIKHHLSK